jgi:hypothetical protein
MLTFRPAMTVGVGVVPALESCDLNGIPIKTTAKKTKERQMANRRIDIAPSFFRGVRRRTELRTARALSGRMELLGR